jgi:hypothetical protein
VGLQVAIRYASAMTFQTKLRAGPFRADTTAVRRFDKREKRGLQIPLVMVAILTLGAFAASWETLLARPAAYETLRTSGALANARVNCSDDPCTLTYTYAGRTHKNGYDNDRRQFGPSRYALVLIDPKHPKTMYTVHDVQRNTNAGFGAFGIFCLLATVGLAILTVILARAVRRFIPITDLRPEASAGAPASARAALLAVYAAQDALYDGTLPSRAMTYRFDPDELDRAFADLSERLAAMPGLEPEVRAIPAELASRVRSAKRTPLIGGVRLDPEPLFAQLDRAWRRVAIVALR